MRKNIIIAGLALALLAALGYLLMGAGVIHAADLTLEDAPPAFSWIAGAFYIIAGILIFLRRRSLLIAFGIINIVPLVVFYIMWAGRPDVLWSLPGLMTKISQLLLEAGLVYLIVTFRRPAPAVT